MKALSVKQPWATLLVEGYKRLEIRSKPINYRGPLVICASKAPANMFWRDTVDNVHRLMHAGCIIGVVNVTGCHLMTKADEEDAMIDYMAGAWAWEVEPVHYCRPDPIVGKIGFFEVPDDKIIRIANDDTDWIFNYPQPQGEIPFTDKCPWV